MKAFLITPETGTIEAINIDGREDIAKLIGRIDPARDYPHRYWADASQLLQ